MYMYNTLSPGAWFLYTTYLHLVMNHKKAEF
jgi:hypothetical protein